MSFTLYLKSTKKIVFKNPGRNLQIKTVFRFSWINSNVKTVRNQLNEHYFQVLKSPLFGWWGWNCIISIITGYHLAYYPFVYIL